MCNFCDFTDDWDGNCLLCKDVDFGCLGSAELRIDLWNPNQMWLELSIDGSDIEVATNTSIKYCPMCGRKLENRSYAET